MPIEFTCPTCLTKLRLRDEYAGECGRCPHCKGTIFVPEAGHSLGVDAPPPGQQDSLAAASGQFGARGIVETDGDRVKFFCASCGTKMKAAIDAAGRGVTCPSCHTRQIIPLVAPNQVTAAITPKAASSQSTPAIDLTDPGRRDEPAGEFIDALANITRHQAAERPVAPLRTSSNPLLFRSGRRRRLAVPIAAAIAGGALILGVLFLPSLLRSGAPTVAVDQDESPAPIDESGQPAATVSPAPAAVPPPAAQPQNNGAAPPQRPPDTTTTPVRIPPTALPAPATLPATEPDGRDPFEMPAEEPSQPRAPQMTPRETISRAIDDLDSGDRSRMRQAAETLQNIDPDEQRSKVAPLLNELLDDNTKLMRLAAARALVHWGTPASVTGLGKLLKDPDIFIRRAAFEALGNLHQAQGASEVARYLATDDGDEAAESLTAMGAVAEDAVLQRLRDAEDRLQRECCKVLAAIGTDKSLAELKKTAKGKGVGVRAAAEQATAAIKDRAAHGTRVEPAGPTRKEPTQLKRLPTD